MGRAMKLIEGVIPAQAGIQIDLVPVRKRAWVLAFAGMTA